LIRVFVYHQRWFVFTAGIVLHTCLHGFFGIGYLSSGVACLVLTLIVAFLLGRRKPSDESPPEQKDVSAGGAS